MFYLQGEKHILKIGGSIDKIEFELYEGGELNNTRGPVDCFTIDTDHPMDVRGLSLALRPLARAIEKSDV